MNSRDNKSSRELKREVLDELNNVNKDLDRLQGRLTPGQFIDDALFTPVGRNPRAVYDHLIANPIGTAFLSLGTLLLMEDDSHVTYESQLRTRSHSVMDKSRAQMGAVKAQVGSVKEKVAGYNDKLHTAVDRTKAKIDSSREKISGLKDKFSKKDDFTTTGEYDLTQGGELGSGSIDDMKQNFGEVKDNVSAKIDSFADNVKSTTVNQVETVKNMDPMTFAAIGAGLGALTGIALPVSEKEQTMIDQRMGNQMTTLSSEFQEAINQSVKVLKDEFLGKFTDFDVSIFGRKNASSGVNETYRTDSQI